MKGRNCRSRYKPLAVTKSRTGFESEEYKSGLDAWLEHQGVKVAHELVFDTRNTGFSAMRKRMVQGAIGREPYVASESASLPMFADSGLKTKMHDHGRVESSDI